MAVVSHGRDPAGLLADLEACRSAETRGARNLRAVLGGFWNDFPIFPGGTMFGFSVFVFWGAFQSVFFFYKDLPI